MPLRDHFRAPLIKQLTWEEFHGGWPMVIVQQLRKQLPPGFVAGPNVHSGSRVEVDVATYEDNKLPKIFGVQDNNGAVATAVWAPPEPTVAVETTIAEDDEYEVRVYDVERGRRLVASLEIVSPANKDRLDKRSLFVAKCAALIQKGIAVSIVDLVTIRHSNLYAELLNLIGVIDPTLSEPPPGIYAASCRWVEKNGRTIFEAWSHTLQIGQPLPTLPLWLGPERVVGLNLEESYLKACDDLWIS